MLSSVEPLDIVQREIIPSLDIIGKGFEEKTVYLPQLLMSAEAAGAAFEKIKAVMAVDTAPRRCPIVLATVQGDIHDIGKNIVKMLLENYGYRVIDLGKDVSEDDLIRVVRKSGAKLAGLSALMTTTLPAMVKSIELVKAVSPECKIMVGGAVVSHEYAMSIGADYYAKDAKESADFAKVVFGS